MGRIETGRVVRVPKSKWSRKHEERLQTYVRHYRWEDGDNYVIAVVERSVGGLSEEQAERLYREPLEAQASAMPRPVETKRRSRKPPRSNTDNGQAALFRSPGGLTDDD